jgi:rubrerythrin
VNSLFLANARAGYAFGRDGQVAVGARFPPLSSSAFCVVGRPLRRNDARAPVAGAQWTAQMVDRISNERAARIWTERACVEWASVPAFCELAQQLKASGAPEGLIARAREAAADELRHAAISAQTAAALAVVPALGLDPPSGSDRAVASGRAGIVRLAVESYLDGCIGEGTAAAVAAREADRAGDADIASMQRTIARDEARHAELAWDILDWTLAVEPETTRAALIGIGPGSVEGCRDDVPGPRDAGPTLERFGILDFGRIQAVSSEQRAGATARLAARLVA